MLFIFGKFDNTGTELRDSLTMLVKRSLAVAWHTYFKYTDHYYGRGVRTKRLSFYRLTDAEKPYCDGDAVAVDRVPRTSSSGSEVDNLDLHKRGHYIVKKSSTTTFASFDLHPAQELPKIADPDATGKAGILRSKSSVYQLSWYLKIRDNRKTLEAAWPSGRCPAA